MKSLFPYYLLIILLVSITLHSCAVDEGPFVDPTCEPDNMVISYSIDIQAIFNSNCVACHTESHPKLNLLTCCSYAELTATGFSAPYINTSTPTASKLYKHLVGELLIMPPSGKLPDHQVDKVLKWIEQGALNN